LIWDNDYREGFCVITKAEPFKEQWLLLKGVPLKNKWPDDVVCRMSSEYPKDIQLSDNLYGCSYRVVSRRLRDILEPLASMSKIEYLPISVLNHKGRAASKDYFVMNPLDVIDCIDQKKSCVVWNAINTTAISSCDQLVLREDSIPTGCAVFRPKFMLPTILARRDIAAQLSSAGLTGLFFLEPSNYKG
jgi:uncharacterized protein DUF1629